MRLGFFIGFLIGAGIASLLSLSEEEEGAPQRVEGRHLMDRVRRQTQEARQAAKEAAAEKEAELRRAWEEARHHPPQ